MPPIEFADSVEIRRRDILAAAAVGLAFGTSSLDALEPIREVRIHEETFAAARRRSMMRIMARRTNAATVAA